VLAVLLRVLLRMGVLPPHPLLYDGMLIASATEMLLLSLALADRITAERHARTEADLQRAREHAQEGGKPRPIRRRGREGKERQEAAPAHTPDEVTIHRPPHALRP